MLCPDVAICVAIRGTSDIALNGKFARKWPKADLFKATQSFERQAYSFSQSPNNAASVVHAIGTHCEHERVWDSRWAVNFYTSATIRKIDDNAFDLGAIGQGDHPRL